MPQDATKNITDDDIESISEEVGVEKDIIESSVKMKRANEKFKRYKVQNNQSNNKKKSNLDLMKNVFIFIIKLFINTRHGPIKGEITDIDNPKNTDKLIIEVSAKYNKVPGIHEKNAEYGKFTITNEETYNLKEDTSQIKYLLEKTDSKEIGDMIGKKTPIIVESENTDPTHSLPEKPYNIVSKISNFYRIYKDYFYTREERQVFESENTGVYELNIMGLLFSSLLLGLVGFLIKEAISSLGISESIELLFLAPSIFLVLVACVGLFFSTIYILLHLWCSIKELVYKRPGERYIIREIINS